MNQSKRSSESNWVHDQAQALRSETPSAGAIDDTIGKVLAYSAPVAAKRPAYRWRMVPLAAALGAGALFLVITTQPAHARSLHDIAEAVRHQATRHSSTYRPDANGKLVLANEDWISGRRNTMLFVEPDGAKTITGYDGARSFRYSTKYGGFMDDVEPSEPPVEDIDAYLHIPGGRLLKQAHVGNEDVYSLSFSNMAFDLYVNPATGLPMHRDVLTHSGKLIERNIYDYPSSISAETFAPPAGLTDFPALRQELASRLHAAGQTKSVGGVTISLKAVLVCKSHLLALWSGGAPGSGGDVWVEGVPKSRARASQSQSPDGFSVAGAWYVNAKLDQPFTISIPVWTEDRTRPILGRDGKQLGFQPKLVGHAAFQVSDAMQAEDPDRVVWKPDGKAVGVATDANSKVNP